MKKGILDLYAILKRRNVTVAEWLEFHNISTVEDFDLRAPTIASEYGCEISSFMREEAYSNLKYKENVPETFEVVQEEPTPVINKKRKSNKKIDLNEKSTEVKSEVSDPEMDMEITNENN